MVTGSKGKGSTAYYLARVLEAHGLRVGFFSSPHLIDQLERIRLDQKAITPPEFLQCFQQMEPALRQIWKALPIGEYIGPVGIFAAVAALWYQQRRVDVAVFETGRGARFDDVTEVRHEGAVLTGLLPEHLRELGPTLDDIAWHKAGIIRADTTWAVTASHPRLLRALASQAPTLEVLQESVWRLASVTLSQTATDFTILAEDGAAHPFHIPVLATFAAKNARLALLAARRFLASHFHWNTASAALQKARFPGRGDLILTTPPILVDGAVRRESAWDIMDALHQSGWLKRPIISLVGIPEDKDWRGVAKSLASLGPVGFLRAENPRLRFPLHPSRYVPGTFERSHFSFVWPELQNYPESLVLALGTQSFVSDVLNVLGQGPVLLDLEAW